MWGSVSGYRNVARSKDKQHTQLHEAYIPVGGISNYIQSSWQSCKAGISYPKFIGT